MLNNEVYGITGQQYVKCYPHNNIICLFLQEIFPVDSFGTIKVMKCNNMILPCIHTFILKNVSVFIKNIP